MPGIAKTSKFLLTQATVMLGKPNELHSLNLASHSLGLVKNFQVVNEPSYVELTQGTMNEVVESIRTQDNLRASCELYEMTAKNLSYAAGLDDANAKLAVNYTNFDLDVDVASAATQCVVTGDATSGIAAGDFIIIQDMSNITDHLHIAKVASATFATGKTTIVFAAGYAVPTGVTFSKTVCKVREVTDLYLGGDATQFYYSMKVVGIMPKDNRAMVLLFPKIKITKGFSINFQNENFANLPLEFSPYPLVPDDALYSFYPTRRMIMFPA